MGDEVRIDRFRLYRDPIVSHARPGQWPVDLKHVTHLRLIADGKEGPRAHAEIILPGTGYPYKAGQRFTLMLTPE